MSDKNRTIMNVSLKKPGIKASMSQRNFYEYKHGNKNSNSLTSNQKLYQSRNNSKNVKILSAINFFDIKKQLKNPKLNRLINKTKSNLLLKDVKIKKSSSTIFQDNDVDLVRNLNFDSVASVHENLVLKENLLNTINNEKYKSIIQREGDVDEIVLPKITNFSMEKTNELIQSRQKYLKKEYNKHFERDLVAELKDLKIKVKNIKTEKNNLFTKIKQMINQIEEINIKIECINARFMQKCHEIYNMVENQENTSKENIKENQENQEQKENEEFEQEYIKQRRKKINSVEKESNRQQYSLMELYRENMSSTKKRKSSIFKNISKNTKNLDTSLHSNNSKDIIQNSSPKKEEKSPSPKKENNSSLAYQPINNLEQIRRKTKIDEFLGNVLKSQYKYNIENEKISENDKINMLKKEIKKLREPIQQMNKQLNEFKEREKVIKTKLMSYYKSLLFEGKDIKNDGLVWIIKAIWNIGENVPMSFMPEFLDIESVEYLFSLAHKHLEVERYKKKIKEMKLKLKSEVCIKNNFNKSNKSNSNNKMQNYGNNEENNEDEEIYNISLIKAKYFNNSKKMEEIENMEKNVENDPERILLYSKLPEFNNIENLKRRVMKMELEIVKMRKDELSRIFKKFIENDYQSKYKTNIDKVLGAIVGETTKDLELTRYNIARKYYLHTLKDLRFFEQGKTIVHD